MVRRVNETETQPISYDEIWDVIRTGKHGLKEKITLIRNRYEAERDITGSVEKAKKVIAEPKADLPAFMCHGTFSTRNNASLVEYSGQFMTDLDSLGDKLPIVRKSLEAYPFVHAIALSPSGDGLKVVINVVNDPSRHLDSFRAIQQFFRDEAGLEIDPACKDLARLTFFTYDPDLWIRVDGNEIISPLDSLPRAKSVTSSPVDHTTREQIAFRLLGELEEAPEKGGYFVRCPGESFHTNRTAEKHTILYLDTVPTLSCQHQSCSHSVEAFNRVLRSEIGKAEYIPGRPYSKNGETPDPEEPAWLDLLSRARVTSDELDTLEIIPRKKLLGNWLAEGDEGIIYAPRGDGKTWFAIGASIAISTGGEFGEFKAPEAIPVLYVDGEMPIDLLRERTRGILKGNKQLQIINHELLFDRTDKVLNLSNPSEQNALLELCLRDQIKVMVLDNGSTLFGGLKENEADSWNPVQRWLLNFRRHHIAVILVLHAGRNGLIRGTSSREDPVAWVISITRSELSETEQGCRFITRFTKQSRNTGGLVVPDYEWYFTMGEGGDISTECKAADSLAVFHAILESGVTDCGQIAKLMNVETFVVSRLAKKAVDQGWLEKRSKGEYRLKTLT